MTINEGIMRLPSARHIRLVVDMTYVPSVIQDITDENGKKIGQQLLEVKKSDFAKIEKELKSRIEGDVEAFLEDAFTDVDRSNVILHPSALNYSIDIHVPNPQFPTKKENR